MGNTCATCKFWEEAGMRLDWRANVPVKYGDCYGPATDHAKADADDDSNLRVWFAPPETFCCSGWAART